MQSNATDGKKHTDDPYTVHRELPRHGGKTYVKCRACGRELLHECGGWDKLVHTDDCPHAGEVTY